jgi:hypothetical protein
MKNGGHDRGSLFLLMFEHNKVKGLPLDAQAFDFTYPYVPNHGLFRRRNPPVRLKLLQ